MPPSGEGRRKRHSPALNGPCKGLLPDSVRLLRHTKFTRGSGQLLLGGARDDHQA
jgi:hypothetical protein